MLSRDATCAHCGGRLSVHEAAIGEYCRDVACQDVRLKSYLGEQSQRRAREAESIRDSVAAEYGIASLNLAVIPANDADVVELSDERRAAFRMHLERIVREAIEMMWATREAEPLDLDGIAVDASQRTQRMAIEACSTCRGYCCFRGGDTAYLTPETILRFWSLHPDLTREHLLAKYIDHLPETSYRPSCVYHTETGCMLTREMRTDLCNRYRCTGLREAQTIARTDPDPVLLLSRTDREVVSTKLVDWQRIEDENRSPASRPPEERPPSIENGTE